MTKNFALFVLEREDCSAIQKKISKGSNDSPTPLALLPAILWEMQQPILNFLTFPNYIPTFYKKINVKKFFALKKNKNTFRNSVSLSFIGFNLEPTW